MVMIHDDVVMMLDVDGWWRRRLDVLYEEEKKGKEEGRRKVIYPTTAEPVTKVPFTVSFSGAGEVGSLWNFVVMVAFFHSPSPRSLFMHSLTRIKNSL